MGITETLADALALDVIKHIEATGDEDIIGALSKTMGDSSQTLQEAFITSVRVQRAEIRARKQLASVVAGEGIDATPPHDRLFPTPPQTALDHQLAFLLEADKLKRVDRATKLADGSRAENSAEHSWHLCLTALTLADQAPKGTDVTRVILMLILHDLVEIDAGDAPIHGDIDHAAQAAAEAAAATRIFGLLPAPQAQLFREIWDEFEAAETKEAQFAKALDRFQPPLLNLANGGGSWTSFNVSEAQITTRVGAKINAGAPKLWAWLAPRITAFFSK